MPEGGAGEPAIAREDIEISESEALLQGSGPGGEGPDPGAKPRQTPAPHGSLSRSASAFQAGIMLFKGMIGAGVLGLPAAFKATGWLGGIVILVVVGLLNAYTGLLLRDAKYVADDILRQRGEKGEDEEVTFADVGAAAFSRGGLGRSLTFFFLVISQLGTCIAYVVFMVNNLSAADPVFASRWLYIGLLGPCLFAFTMFRSMASLSPVAIIGTALFVVGIALVVFESLSSWNPPSEFPAYRADGVDRFVGTAIFALSGINLVIPVEESLRHASQFDTIYYSVLAALVAVYASFGLFFWGMLGDDVPSELTLAFPSTVGGVAARVCLCFYIFATYIINMFPVSELYDQWAHHRLSPALQGTVGHPWVIRALLVSFTCVLAGAVSDFGPFLALVGYVGFGFQGLIAPGAYSLALTYDKLTSFEEACRYALVLGGLALAVVGAYYSIADL